MQRRYHNACPGCLLLGQAGVADLYFCRDGQAVLAVCGPNTNAWAACSVAEVRHRVERAIARTLSPSDWLLVRAYALAKKHGFVTE